MSRQARRQSRCAPQRLAGYGDLNVSPTYRHNRCPASVTVVFENPESLLLSIRIGAGNKVTNLDPGQLSDG